MIELCEVCHKPFQKTSWDIKSDKYMANICSSNCFSRLLNTQPKKYANINLESIENFTESDHSMRSSYEIGMSKWFIDNKINYIYEPFIFSLSNKRKYVPDFYIPLSDIFIEVKGKWIGEAFTKVSLFQKEFNHRFIVITLPFMRHLKIRTKKYL